MNDQASMIRPRHPSSCRRRVGAALVEMLVAFTLSALVAAGAALALTAAERYARRTQAQRDDQRVLHDAELILRSDLRPAAFDSLRALGDTAIDFFSVTGTSVTCVVAGASMVFPPATVASGDPFTAWRVAPDVGDAVFAWDTSAGGRWRLAIVDSIESRSDGAGCTPASGLVSAADSAARTAVLLVHTDRVFASGVVVGAPVRIERRIRYVLVRGADRQWSLSLRRCTVAGTCSASQPAAGPLASAADSGFIVALAPGSRHFDITLRAPSHTGLATRAALDLTIAVRNRGGSVP